MTLTEQQAEIEKKIIIFEKKIRYYNQRILELQRQYEKLEVTKQRQRKIWDRVI